MHLQVLATAERAPQQHLVPAGHPWAVRRDVFVVLRPWDDLVGGAGLADEKTQAELGTADAAFLAHDLCRRERVGETLSLLQTQEPQWEPRPRRHPHRLAGEPVEE